ncbi:MAG: hypothetical protein HYU58_07685 [Proteobacteria bacterium]|nr:hypothetical protein [Pseudomonadota bacterium]
MRDRLRTLSIAAALLASACSGSGSSAGLADNNGTQPAAARPSEDQLLELLPDRTTADCLGSLEFVSLRQVEGRSRCSGHFSGSTDGSLAAGTLCVYSTKVESKTATDFTAGGHFVCSEGTHGVVRFRETQGRATGVATATASDGRIVTITYQ